MIRVIELNSSSTYNVISYPREGFYLVKETDTGNNSLVCFINGFIMSIYSFPVGTAFPDWMHDLLPQQNESKEVIEDVGSHAITDEMLLKIIAVSRGQEVSGL
jgi:hypothetical protein